ncbi:MAG: hypothetical protein A2268_08100 [Candidatus Raymondbacteria bacterium RifOxyA12_full_50_37]|uniref:Uncharacterized protein n=1 Tax=Candidatus Raymondbacteria bacterium RIFOXYD12_FULL_49_13 TaxID=1817890 RepID=A0A1F7F159_UNCRA|nr:MAG: hypothetical protein A2268_08100 [Candidatus Raymondbacteria bacterium RifOxyA12_full_50_37]OGJ93317.1 MAG: hypothetical protein A2487_06835 [Candidatus Raymondbacteria bacterium RifOxyC12_full_50_8]OGJ93529.1 MAG: hypothetical protein A2248_09145 [Candidatus Raymondbacteria bacterium RIFOXYA2_FULL_49_16]OGJ98799.1 MAG: hypothetical protein A2453_09955 [Candidatus Raymondbacteria bacterium RIFOXYC2_FULL_50_21]OGK00338.1 MAG: hypothetical protein A2519_01085 [Candidatus Raymondbacteria b
MTRCAWLLPLFIGLLIGLPPWAELKWKPDFSCEIGLKHDANIILPDSVTDISTFISEGRLSSGLFVQKDRSTMVKLSASAENKQLFAVSEYITVLGGSLQLKHLFSHLTMLNLSVDGERYFSDNPYYTSGFISCGATWGRYFNAEMNLELSTIASQKTFPDLFRTDLDDRTRKSFYYDFRLVEAGALVNRALGKKFTVRLDANAGYKNFFNDTHDSDYVGSTQIINYIDINTGDTIYDYIPLYQQNIQQQDWIISGEGSCTWTPAQNLYIISSFLIRQVLSNDPYFNANHLAPAVRVEYSVKKLALKSIFSYYKEVYPDREAYADGEEESSVFTGLSCGYRITKSIRTGAGIYYKQLDSSIPFYSYSKTITTLNFSYSF